VTRSPDQAVLAVVRLIGDQDVEVSAHHPSSTSAAVTVRVGRALLYLNDQATAGHFHKVWFDAAAQARTLPPLADRALVRAVRGMPEPGVVANAVSRPPCSVAMVGADTPGVKPFLRIQLGRLAFEVRDFSAYRSCLGAFRQAEQMSRDVFLPPGTERVYSGALAAARDAFHPDGHGSPTPPGPSRGRRVPQTTTRSAPVTPAPRPTAATNSPDRPAPQNGRTR
jgi:hypothetical protein